jgi:hypothetical protein
MRIHGGLEVRAGMKNAAHDSSHGCFFQCVEKLFLRAIFLGVCWNNLFGLPRLKNTRSISRQGFTKNILSPSRLPKGDRACTQTQPLPVPQSLPSVEAVG